MAGIISSLRSPLGGNYNLWRLVDARFLERTICSPQTQHIICDIDKTYLETEFDTFFQIAKIAFEDAEDKKTVRGAGEVLLALRWGLMDEQLSDQRHPRPLHFVSSSPPQLRKVLESKFALDGLDWSSDTFKDQAYNIRKGRFDQLRQQIAYKTAAILNVIHQQGGAGEYYMIGDNAEADIPIYLGIKLYFEQRLSRAGYLEYLQLMGVEAEVGRTILDRFTKPMRGTVKAIVIRRVKQLPYGNRSALSKVIVEFDSYLEVAVLFFLLGLLSTAELAALLRTLHNRFAIPRSTIAAVLRAAQDLAPTLMDPAWYENLCSHMGMAVCEVRTATSMLRLPQEHELAHLNEAELLQLCKRTLIPAPHPVV